MSARVAFKAEVYKEEKVTTKFRGTDGSLKEKSRSSETNEELVYAYECEIGYEGDPEELFQNRFLEVHEQCKPKRWEKGLFQTDEKEERSFLSVHSDDGEKQSGSLWVSADDTYRKDRGEKTQEAVGAIPKMVYSLTAKIVSLDSAYRGTLEDILCKKHDAFFGPKKWRYDFDTYCSNIRSMSARFYKYMFPDDKKLIDLPQVLEACAGVIELYDKDFPAIVDGIVNALLLEAKKYNA